MKNLILFILLSVASYGQNASRLVSLNLSDVLPSTGAYRVLTYNETTDAVESVASDVLANTSSGSYVPTLTAIANCSSLVLQTANYMKIGNIVRVSIYVTGTAAAANTLTTISATLPIAKLNATPNQKVGTFSIFPESNIAIAGGFVYAGATTATMSCPVLSASGTGFQFVADFQYDITK